MCKDFSFLERVTLECIAKFIKDEKVNIYAPIPSEEIYCDAIEAIETLLQENIQDQKAVDDLLKTINTLYTKVEEIAFICGMRAGAKMVHELLPQMPYRKPTDTGGLM